MEFSLPSAFVETLQHKPVIGILAAAVAYMNAYSLEHMHDVMESTTPIIKYATMIFGCGIAFLTFLLKARELLKSKKAHAKDQNASQKNA